MKGARDDKETASWTLSYPGVAFNFLFQQLR